MKKPIALTALILAVATASAADVPPRSQFTRGDSALRMVERSDSYEKGSFARWTGTLELAGKIVVEFDRPVSGIDPQEDVGVIYFEPSDASLGRLPAAVGRYYPLRPTVLWLGGTPAEVLTPMLGSARVQQMVKAKPPRFEVPAKLRLRELFTSVECDHRAYEIKYEGLALLGFDLVAVGEARNLGC